MQKSTRVCLPFVVLILLCATGVRAQNAATAVFIDASVNRHPINPNIYGTNFGDAEDIASLNAPLNRNGGNATSRYNWQLDAHSSGSDWYFETYSDGTGTPGASADTFVKQTRAAGVGAEPMMTIPMIDYLANLGPGRSTLAGFSVKKYGAQKASDPWNADAGNGVSSATGKNITGNDPLDTGVSNSSAIQQAYVQHFVSTFGPASSTTGVKYYLLDNEHSLWHATHRDVHPTPSTYDEVYDKIVSYASAIRATDPTAKIVGPEEWSWSAMHMSGLDQGKGTSVATSDYQTHGKTYYYPWLLQKLAAYKQKTGVQLIDILTVHGYNMTPDGSDDSASAQRIRNRETRILWDPYFQDPSWYGDLGINGRVINWIPTLRAMVNTYYPGLQIGFTEYSWGDEANLNGATTQADVLGIYGREGLDLATRWGVAKDYNKTPKTYYITHLASKIYRDYDGNRSTFGDTSVSTTVDNPDNLSAYAAVRASDGALTVMVINKQQGSTPVTVNLANFATNGPARTWQINSAAQTAIAHLSDVPVDKGVLSTTVPSQSITLFVLPAGTPVPPVSRASLVNLSTRAYCSSGNGVTIGGFVVTGSTPKRVLVRAIGPSLAAYGLGASEVLADPLIEVHDARNGNVVIATNNDWRDNANAADLAAVGAGVGALPLLETDTKSAGMLISLQPGAYTFVAKGNDGGSGIVLIEVYDVFSAQTNSSFANISARTSCTTGNGVTIGGFVIGGTANKRVLLRAVGQTLADYGLNAADLLTDPSIELHDASHGNVIIATNDNWGDNPTPADITATASRVGAFPFAASDTKSSALLVSLPPGVYSFIARGASSAPNGIVLIEAYDAD